MNGSVSSKSTFSREASLKESFDAFWSSVLGEGQYYDRLTIEQFVELKKAVSDINNIITLKVTQAFLGRIKDEGVLTEKQYVNAMSRADETDANTNGYDVELSEPRLVAEVKCNIPVNVNSFGAQQVNGILKDIQQMWSPSKKTKSDASTDKGYLRFMVLLDCDGVRTAMKKIITKATSFGISICDEQDVNWTHLSTGSIYVIYINLTI